MKPFVFLNIHKFECTVGHIKKKKKKKRKKITISKFEFNIITNNKTISSMINFGRISNYSLDQFCREILSRR